MLRFDSQDSISYNETEEATLDLELRGRLAVVTGAAQGIGFAIAEAFVAEGARVLLVDVSAATASAAASLKADHLVVDLAERGAAAEVAARAAAAGGADILVNNAGITRPAPIDQITDDDWRDVMAVNIDAALRLTRDLWVQLKARRGAVVNIASFAAKRATLFGNNASYVVSKHAIAGLTRAAALDGARDGVRVNAVAPGVVATEMVKLHDEATRHKIQTMIPLGSYAMPAEIADVVLFLASRRASHVTGEVMNVNGGLVMD